MRNFEEYSACLLSVIKDKRLKKTFWSYVIGYFLNTVSNYGS
jgi:hypothetical protein